MSVDCLVHLQVRVCDNGKLSAVSIGLIHSLTDIYPASTPGATVVGGRRDS